MHSSRILTLVTALAAVVAAIRPGLAQDTPPPVPPPAAAAVAPLQPEPAGLESVAEQQLERAKEQLARDVEGAEQATESLKAEARQRAAYAAQARATAEADRKLLEVKRTFELAQASASPAIDVAPGAPAVAVGQRVHSIVGRAPARVLVIRFDKTDAAAQTNLEEDMNVMARVLERSVIQKLGEEDGPKASGIQVLFAPDAGAARNLYLEGYGSVFVMNVRFPLIAPADKQEEEKPKPETDSSWEDAKRDLYGENDPWNIGKALRFEFHGAEPQPYDADKVERLRQSLVESMKSAANIRGLKPDEWIVVTVLGGANQGPAKVKTVRKSGGDRPGGKRPAGSDDDFVYELRDAHAQAGGGRGSVMTLRVKKMDVDEFSKGRMNLEQFRKRVSITTYPANTSSGGGLF